jgi:hypothetical protein
MKEGVSLKGTWKATLRGPDGKVKTTKRGRNLITTAGKSLAADLIGVTGGTKLTHIAIGTSSTAAAVGQTALQGSELARSAATVTDPSNTVNMTVTFGAGTGTGTIEECGIFNAASLGTMFSRFLTGTITKGAADSLTIDWTLTIS